MDQIERPGSGEYSRAGNDSLYPSGLWETHNAVAASTTSLEKATELLLKRAASQGGQYQAYSDKMPIIGHNNNTMNLDDEAPMPATDYMSRTFPRSHHLSGSGNNNTSSHNHNTNNNNNNNVGYPSDYGLPIVPGAEQVHNKLSSVHPMHHSSTGHVPTAPMNAKTLRVWQKGGVPVLPPVTALKRALSSSRNSPDEGYQEGCGTDV
jgi:hypothetical protein